VRRANGCSGARMVKPKGGGTLVPGGPWRGLRGLIPGPGAGAGRHSGGPGKARFGRDRVGVLAEPAGAGNGHGFFFFEGSAELWGSHGGGLFEGESRPRASSRVRIKPPRPGPNADRTYGRGFFPGGAEENGKGEGRSEGKSNGPKEGKRSSRQGDTRASRLASGVVFERIVGSVFEQRSGRPVTPGWPDRRHPGRESWKHRLGSGTELLGQPRGENPCGRYQVRGG